MRSRKSLIRILSAVFPLCFVVCLSGCGKFFVPQNSGGGGGGGTSTGNYFYVANESETASVAGFVIGTSGITNTSNSPYGLGVVPSAMAVTPNGRYLYVSSEAGAIYGFSINGNGALSLLNGGSALISSITPTTLRVDPSGNWLIAADPIPQAYVFSINSSTGKLTPQGGPLGLSAGAPNHIVFSPTNGLVFISLANPSGLPNTGGVQVCTLDQSTGELSRNSQFLLPISAGNSDYGLAVDPAGKYLFVTETGVNAVRVLSIGASGALTKVSGSPFKTGLGPVAVLVDSTGSYVYVANRTDGTISAFSLATTGSLSAVSGSPFATGRLPSDLAEDTSNTYLGVASAGGSPDFQVFTIGSATSATPGGLTNFAKTVGANPSGTLAVVAAD